MNDPENGGIVVTGASGALGSAVCRRLSGAGFGVVGIARPGGRARCKPLISELGEAFRCVEIDQSNAASWQAAADDLAAFGPPAGAVLVAGTWRGGKPFHESAGSTDWELLMAANLEAARHALGGLLPGMVSRGGGSIVLVGSRTAVRPWEGAGSAAYVASKAALVALAQTVAAEVVSHGVRVNTVLPGVIDTAANRDAMPNADHSRWVAPDSIAHVVEFLLSDGARDVFGASIPVYGRS